MERRARIYSLVLDPSDKMAAILIAAIDQYLAIRAAEQPVLPDTQYGSSCPYCSTGFASSTERDARRALSAHIRQMHPREWSQHWKK
jgi:hypothetical protein